MSGMRRTQRGNNVHLVTTITPVLDALIKGAEIKEGEVQIGSRSRRGAVAEFIARIVERHFEETYGLPFFILNEILIESEVLEKIEENEEKPEKSKFYPLAPYIVQQVVDRHKKAALVANLYGGSDL
jgi:hypothetical protein